MTASAEHHAWRARHRSCSYSIPDQLKLARRGGGGGYSLFSDDRDDRRSSSMIVVIGDLVFLGVVQANWFLLGYKNRSFEYASLINSGLLVFLG